MSELFLPPRSLNSERLDSAYTYAGYRQLIDELMAQNRTTGPNQDEQIISMPASISSACSAWTRPFSCCPNCKKP